MVSRNINFPIDFVISWVDSSDSEWRRKRNNYLEYADEKVSDTSEERYRDFGFFRFLLKSIKLYTPWVHHVYIVTDNQIPDCVPNDERFSVIDHSQFIPASYLPTFNSSVIELYLNNIPNLVEHFVYFNDDMLINGPMNSSDFFDVTGLPKDSFLSSMLQPQRVNYFEINNAQIINDFFKKNMVVTKYEFQYLVKTALTLPFSKWSTFKNLHVPYSLCKKEYEWLDKYAKDELLTTSQNKFRSESDINIWLLQDIRYCLGLFATRSTSIGHYMNFDNLPEIINALERNKPKLLVINDDSEDVNLDRDSIAKKITIQMNKKFL